MVERDKTKMIVVLGPTASGKTLLASNLAYCLNGEVISADSRQVYRGMDLGTGKDYQDYIVKGTQVPFHLVDIAEPGTEYNVFRYQHDFLNVWSDLVLRRKTPIVCGGTGLYIEAVLRGYRLVDVPEDKSLREKLANFSIEELARMLSSFRSLHNVTDIKDRNRAIRAIEISRYYRDHPKLESNYPEIDYLLFGILFSRDLLRERITQRFKLRLKEGMIEEVRDLLKNNLEPAQLKFYGLEYRYITQLVKGEIDYDDMFQQLNSAIHQFAKRQMTWFRKMEREGFRIHWIDGNLTLDEKISEVLGEIKNKAAAKL